MTTPSEQTLPSENDPLDTQGSEAQPGTTPRAGPASPPSPETPAARSAAGVAPSSRRQAFADLRRQLTDDDLASAGVQKLLLDDLERAEAECDILATYQDRFHDADKKVAVLEERLHQHTGLEIFFAVGITLGGAIIGLTPFLWPNPPAGPIALVIGLAMIVGSAIARIFVR